MPPDSRRITGPENTLQYLFYSKQKKTYEDLEKELINSFNLRKDARQPLDARKMCKYISLLKA